MISPIHIARLWTVGLVAVMALACATALYASFGLPDAYEGLVPGWVPNWVHPAPPPADPTDDLAVETFLPQQLRDMTPDQARAFNMASPLERLNPAPAPFHPEWLSPADLDSATDCMASAIYYEANSEPFAGQLAVAQVILNRLRHPRFPKTVCAVINQGSERSTGCQFSFACDGSLARRPDPAGLQRARSVAQAALHGAVSTQAGQATHYHTIWIVPIWAAELRKVAIVSHHVFYRPPAFYAGYAPPPVLPGTPEVARVDDPPANADTGNGIKPDPVLTHQLAVNDRASAPVLVADAVVAAPLPPADAGETKPAPVPEAQTRFRFGGERRRAGALPLSGK
jgi:spore germination cell wall hydrolase CwlJ-like protein